MIQWSHGDKTVIQELTWDEFVTQAIHVCHLDIGGSGYRQIQAESAITNPEKKLVRRGREMRNEESAQRKK
jgi:hypothetical protein